MTSAVVDYSEAIGVLNGKEIAIPQLGAATIFLATQGVERILVPVHAPGTRERAKAALESLPPNLRRRIGFIDRHGTTLRRVQALVRPIEEESPAFLDEAFTPLYHMALGLANGALSFDADLPGSVDLIPAYSTEKFSEEARLRFSQIGHLLTRYEPLETPRLALRAHATGTETMALLDRLLTEARFHEISRLNGRMGHFRNPLPLLRMTKLRVSALARTSAFRGTVALGRDAAALACLPLPTHTLNQLTDELAKGRTYAPPMLDSGMATYPIYEASLARRSPSCRPPKGYTYQISKHRPHGLVFEASWMKKQERQREEKQRRMQPFTDESFQEARKALARVA